MKLLITGSNGQLGRCLQDRMDSQHFDLLAADTDACDITDKSAVYSFFYRHKPDLVINSAAYTAVDKAESEPELAAKINALGPAHLAGLCAELDIPLIHISTDYVFDGLGIRPYHHSDCTNPQSVYGTTKLDGERAVIAATPKYLIIRTAWVFSEYGNNFVKTILRLAGERDKLTIVADQYGCPTYAGDLADAILKIAINICTNENWNKYGTYHFCGEETTSWHGFARAIIAVAFQKGLLQRKPLILPIATRDYPTPAIRPEYSVLDCQDFPVEGLHRNWQRGLEKVLDNIMKQCS